MKVKRLTIEEELQLIDEYVKNSNFIGHGSSRAVFWGPDETVIKIGLTRQAKSQNAHEVAVFEQAGEEGIFAEIYSVGRNIVVMEYIDTDQIEMFEEMFNFWSEGSTVEDYEEYIMADLWLDDYEKENWISCFKEASFVWNRASDILGDSGDTYQVGFSGDGLKLFDYGWDSRKGYNDQVGTLDITYTRAAVKFREQLLDEENFF